MRKYLKTAITSFCFLAAVSTAFAQKPELKEVNGVKRLMYHGEPFLMLSGETHNSTASSLEYLEPAMAAAKQMHMNSVIVTVEWDQFEPQEGKYDFTNTNNIITLAEKYDLPVVIAWFGTWKNGVSSYIPRWMKDNQKKYFRAEDEKGECTDYISSFCTAARDADARAFAALMKYIKQRDTDNMVLFMQVENETGLWGSNIDYCKQAQKAFAGNVPSELIAMLQQKETSLDTPLKDYWVENGRKTKGTWKEVFGDNDYAEAFFMQWAYASYLEAVAKAGKAEYDIPMYTNNPAMGGFKNTNKTTSVYPEVKEGQGGPMMGPPPGAAGPFGGGKRGPYMPTGAPVPDAFDLYHVIAPSLDFFSPDIYSSVFSPVSDAYTRLDNPLFIPETSRDASPAYYAFATNNAIGFSAFAYEDAYLNKEYVLTFKTLEELLPVISEYQGTGKMYGFHREKNAVSDTFELDGYTVNVSYIDGEKYGYGLIIKTSDEDFVVSGVGAVVTISKNDPKKVTRFDFIKEGHYKDGKFVEEVLLNGDQTNHAQQLYLRGRIEYQEGYIPSEGEVLPRRNVAVSETRQRIVTERTKAPSVYNVRVFTYNR